GARGAGVKGSLLVLLMGCVEAEAPLEIPAADPIAFRTTVYPILLADCGFPACHGDARRFFSVFGPGRTRLDPMSAPYDPATPDELAQSYTRARSMLLAPTGVRRSPLLRKPLAVAAGGAGHGGADAWGANLYASKDDPRFRALFFWATAAAEVP
ncbi:MAG: hypothetical protein NT062_27605, partial [Proteobacteria bacterium]|nr:hypothetical protein [Pseudomonadota bacterium]